MKLATFLPLDKSWHVIVGFTIFAIATHIIGPKYALGLVLAVGILKEVYDSFHRDVHTPELLDATATFVGGLVGYSITM